MRFGCGGDFKLSSVFVSFSNPILRLGGIWEYICKLDYDSYYAFVYGLLAVCDRVKTVMMISN